MWPFNRSKKVSLDTPAVPEEIQEYYQAEKRERIGVAWLLALATFAIVVVGVLGLFFVGKWVYHTVKKDKGNIATTAQTEVSSPTASPTSPPSSSPNSNTTAPTTPAPAPTNAPTTTTPAPTPVAAAPKLTNTGPGDVVEIFVLTSTAAGATHHLATSRRRKSV